MTCFACLFEAKSIQDYILRSGRLRHIVGASELIDALGRDLLDDAVYSLGLQKDQLRFSRRAGGAVFAFSDSREVRDAFRDLWTLTVRQFAPGLPFVSAVGEGENDYKAYLNARDQLEAARNWQVTAALPAGTPVTRYAPRTGLPAMSRDKKFGDLDGATKRFGQDEFWKRGHLSQRFVTNSKPNEWPNDLNYRDDGATLFPFVDDNRYLGLLHADGNVLGQLLKLLSTHVENQPDRFVEVFCAFSEAVETATRKAAEHAGLKVLDPARKLQDDAEADDPAVGVYPARPIVLGGDDLTILIRADLAIPFAKEFLLAFEQHSREQLEDLKEKFPNIPNLPEALTAGAGIAFVKSNHPFYMANELVEGLAKWAKDRAKEHKQTRSWGERTPPTLAFYRVTTASHSHYGDVRRDELTFGDDQETIVTSLGAYGIDPQPQGLPALDDLCALAKELATDQVARGPARQILTLMGQDVNEARRRYARWREVMEKRDQQAKTPIARNIEEKLVRLCGSLDDRLPVSKDTRTTPLADVATLLTIGGMVTDEDAASSSAGVNES